MKDGVIVASGVVGALALCETVLPWAFAMLQKWWQERAMAKTDKSAPRAGNNAAAQCPLSSVRTPGADCSDESQGPADTPFSPADQQPEASGQRVSDDASAADRLWEEARGMAHSFIPDLENDTDYLTKIHNAANLGHFEAMVKLGEYAYRRRAIVEAYYWTALAELKGAKGIGRVLWNIRSEWLAAGCPAQYENIYDRFSEQQGAFARALLRIHCNVDRTVALERMKALARAGCQEALLFLNAASKARQGS